MKNRIEVRYCLYKKLFSVILFMAFFILQMVNASLAQQDKNHITKSAGDKDPLLNSFISPPDSVKPRVYWWWLFNRVDKEGITRDMEEFKAKGIIGVNLICTGDMQERHHCLVYRIKAPNGGNCFDMRSKKPNVVILNSASTFRQAAGQWRVRG
jgi:hypothetical protein